MSVQTSYKMHKSAEEVWKENFCKKNKEHYTSVQTIPLYMMSFMMLIIVLIVVYFMMNTK